MTLCTYNDAVVIEWLVVEVVTSISYVRMHFLKGIYGVFLTMGYRGLLLNGTVSLVMCYNVVEKGDNSEILSGRFIICYELFHLFEAIINMKIVRYD